MIIMIHVQSSPNVNSLFLHKLFHKSCLLWLLSSQVTPHVCLQKNCHFITILCNSQVYVSNTSLRNIEIHCTLNGRLGGSPMYLCASKTLAVIKWPMKIYVLRLVIAVCKDSYVVYGCGFDGNGK